VSGCLPIAGKFIQKHYLKQDESKPPSLEASLSASAQSNSSVTYELMEKRGEIGCENVVNVGDEVFVRPSCELVSIV
jgi:hypothetical protein